MIFLKHSLAQRILLSLLAILLPNLAIAEEPDLKTDLAWVLSAKPSAILMATGGGLEIGREITKTGVLLVNAELDHFLVGGTLFLGASWRQFLYDGWFVQTGLGQAETFFHSSSSKRLGSFTTGGFEFQRPGNFRPGIDLLGYHKSNNGNTMIGFPKLRLTFRF